jgi:hypothetical protein
MKRRARSGEMSRLIGIGALALLLLATAIGAGAQGSDAATGGKLQPLVEGILAAWTGADVV